jgi:hypothetical protein
MLFIITADTIDGNPEKTNTGKTFLQGQTIIWYYGDWWELPRCTPASERLDIYDSCTEPVDTYEVCDAPVVLVDVYEICP